MSTVRRTFSLLLVALCGPAIGCSGQSAVVSVDAHEVKPRGGSAEREAESEASTGELSDTVRALRERFEGSAVAVDYTPAGSIEKWAASCDNAIAGKVVMAQRVDDTPLLIPGSDMPDHTDGRSDHIRQGWLELTVDVVASSQSSAESRRVRLSFARAGVYSVANRSRAQELADASAEIDLAWAAFEPLRFEGLRLAFCDHGVGRSPEHVFLHIPIEAAVSAGDDGALTSLVADSDGTFEGASFSSVVNTISGDA